MEAFQQRYKEESKGQGGDLVLFTDALEHLTRLSRVRCRPLQLSICLLRAMSTRLCVQGLRVE